MIDGCFMIGGKDRRNPLKNRIVKRTQRAFGEVPKIKIAENLTEQKAFELEVVLIKAIGRRNLGTGPLVNLTEGGDGPSGMVVSEASRQKLSAAMKQRKLSPEHRAKIREANIGRKFSPETLAKMSLAQRRRFEDPDQRAAMSASLTGNPLSDKQLAGYAARRGRSLSVEQRLAISKSNTGRKHTPETLLKMSNSHKGKVFSEDHKAALSARVVTLEWRNALSVTAKRRAAAKRRALFRSS